MTSSTRRLVPSCRPSRAHLRLGLAAVALGVASALLLAPRAAAAFTEDDCSFSASSPFSFNEDAFLAQNDIRLTTAEVNEIGTAFHTTAIPLTATTSFHAHFRIKISPNAAGADGIAFVMHNDVAAGESATAIGTGAGGMGYGGITPSVIVEFDTYKNTGGDPNANHVGLMLNGSATTHTATGTPAFTMANGGLIDAWVDYASATTTLNVYVSNSTTKPATPIITHSVNVFTQLGAQMFVGFTSATESTIALTNQQDVVELELSTAGVPCTCGGDTECSGATPACATSGICATCSATNDTACTGATPVCDVPTNSCVGCLSNGDCPGGKPICDATSLTCRACAAADCSGTTPECATTGANSGKCVVCTADVQCPGTTPRCAPTNTCVQCLSSTDCGGDTPICTGGVCQACASDGDCSGATPACEVWGACGQCTDTNSTACGGGDGICDFPTGTCVACEFNSDCAGSLPTCNTTSHTCQPCTDDADCENNPAGDACVTSGMKMGSCVICAQDSDCTSAAAPKCDTVANQCVACLTSADCSAPTPVCDTSNLCVGCLTATDCTSAAAPVCDPTSASCTACSNDYSATNPGPLPCPTAALPACQPAGTTLPGQCAVCSSLNDSLCVTQMATPVCVVDAATCGCTVDTDCNTGSYCDTTTVATGTCATGCRAGDGGVANCATGEYCSKTDGTVGTCMTQPCNSNADCKAPDPVCNTTVQPYQCAECLNDPDCPKGEVCDATNHCAACTSKQTGNCLVTGAGSACLANETCGCATDKDCGTSTSGRVCNTKTNACEAGCVGTGGNGCPSGATCSSTTGKVGTCQGGSSGNDGGTSTKTKDAGAGADGSLNTSTGSSGGCGCRTASRREGTGAGGLAGLVLGLALAARRRRSV